MSEMHTGFTVVFDQPDFLVVNKMTGIDMHDDAGVPAGRDHTLLMKFEQPDRL
jgi:23S rRNA-/tRNA-specific pseudouridylate synthase